MSRLTKNISANFLSNVWSTFLLLLLTPLYIDFLGIESYGLIGFYISWIALLGILDNGISATASREIAWLSARTNERKNIPNLIRTLEVTYWGIVLIIGVIILIGIKLYGSSWFQSDNLDSVLIQDALILMAISLVLQVPSGLYIGGLMGMQRQVECSMFVALFGTVRGVGAILVLWLVSPDIKTYFLWNIVASGIQTGIMRSVLWRKINLTKCVASFSIEALHSVKMFAGGMMLITALALIMGHADKIILSRLISLEMFGYYMLAWTVASALSRISTPLIQAIGPYFTELASMKNEEVISKQLRLASQFMNALILPPTALIIFFAEPIINVWVGNQAVAEGVSPILMVLIVGTMFTSCSYPLLSVLYSYKKIRMLVMLNVTLVVILLPLLVIVVKNIGTIGAAYIWVLYGLAHYFVTLNLGLRLLMKHKLIALMMKDFMTLFFVSFSITGGAWLFLENLDEKLITVLLLGCVLVICWFITMLSSQVLRKNILERLS
ncbi:MAG: oligosaccharide flippase family protein [Proteobacteria bacterium]|nr:oligosaccharide flippase family protein [Pseudomonadota bacterium]